MRKRPPVRRSRGAACWTCLLILGSLVSCSEPVSDALRPVEAAHAADTRTGGATTVGPTKADPPTTAGPPTAPLDTPMGAEPGIEDDGARDDTRMVDEALAGYDRALTTLLRDPSALTRPGDPVVAAWRATIAPGAILADDVTRDVDERRSTGQVVTPPDGSDRSYLHRVVAIGERSTSAPVEVGDAASIRFTWCGWSPGVVRDASTGKVIDVRVGHATGTGAVRKVGTTWLVDSLDETTIEVLPAGTPDPCSEARR